MINSGNIVLEQLFVIVHTQLVHVGGFIGGNEHIGGFLILFMSRVRCACYLPV